MTVDTFVSKYLGKYVEYHSFDPKAKNQCVDLANQYIVEVLKLPAIIGTNAIDFPKKANGNYQVIQNTPSGVPEKGDLVIFKSTDGVGHISIFLEGTASLFTSFDQNYPTGSVCTKVRHNYTNVVSWMRPLVSTQEPMPDTIQLDKKTFEQLVTKATLLDSFTAIGVKSVTDIEDLKRMAKESQDERNTAVEESKNTREAFSNYKQRVAEKLQSPQDLERVIAAIDDTLRKLEQATTNGQNDASENQKYEAQIVELQAELSRLKLLIQAQNPLSLATAHELLTELLKRLSTILKRN